jgi:hypothetical protein
MIYAKLAGILLSIVGLFAAGYHFGEMPYKTKYETLRAADWENKAKGEEAAKTVIAGQLVALQTQIKVNSDAMQTLQHANDSIASDHTVALARVRRLEQLLTAAATPRAPAGAAVSQADGGPGAAGASDSSSASQIEGVLIAAADECEQTANQLNALISEIQPQL